MATKTVTPPPPRDDNPSSHPTEEQDGLGWRTSSADADSILSSPSKRARDESGLVSSPPKRSRHDSAPSEGASDKNDNATAQAMDDVGIIRDSLVGQLAGQVLERFRSATVDEICAANPQLPIHAGRRTSVHISLGDDAHEATSWIDLPSSMDELTAAQTKDLLSRRRIQVASVALTLLQPDFRNLEHLHQHYLHTFVSYNIARPAWQLDILHDLKVQLSFIKLQQQEEQDREEIVDIFFPHNIEQQLRGPPGKTRPMNAIESEFLSRCHRTRNSLISYHNLKVLSQKQPWRQFLQNAVNHAKIEVISLDRQTETNFDKESLLKAEKEHEQLFLKTNSSPDAAEETTEDDLLTQAALAAHAQERAHQASGLRASTSEQLAKGRIAASSKPSQRLRDPRANQSHRRPWSREEEDALLKGLDIVKGPFWSQILALFGEKGSISTILRDRNQVQLKDKARNLKLFFLKNDQPVPKSLEKVTGDLKSRAPMYLLSPDDTHGDAQLDVSSASMQPQTIGNGASGANGISSDQDQEEEENKPVSGSSTPASPPPADEYSANEDMPDVPTEGFDEAMEAAIRQAVASVQAEQDRAKA